MYKIIKYSSQIKNLIKNPQGNTMNVYIKRIVLSTLLFNAAPLHSSQNSLLEFTDSAKILLTDTYKNIKDTISTSPYYEFAPTVIAASCIMLICYYISKNNAENPKNRFKYLPNQEFTMLAQQLKQTVDSQLETIANLVVLYDSSQDHEYKEKLEKELSELLHSTKITKVSILCNELIGEVKTRIRKLKSYNYNLSQDIDYQALATLKVELTHYLELIQKVKNILGLVEVLYNHSSHHYSNDNHDYNDNYHSMFNSYHNSWYCNDDYRVHTEIMCNDAQNSTQETTTNSNNESKISNPALMDVIKNINSHDILLSSLS